MLKADLHIHTKEDPCDKVAYTAKEMIKYKSKLGFKVLAITNHNSIYFNKELEDYAKSLGVILLPGMEALIGGKEVLILNADKNKLNYWQPNQGFQRVYKSLYPSLEILSKVKDEGMVIGAPHPFFPHSNCLSDSLISNINNFDFIEHSHFYVNFLNKNKRAIDVAKQFNKPLLASTDSHQWFQLGLNNYSCLDSEFNKEDILEAIRKGNLEIVTEPLDYSLFAYIGWLNIYNQIDRKILSNIGITSKYKNI